MVEFVPLFETCIDFGIFEVATSDTCPLDVGNFAFDGNIST